MYRLDLWLLLPRLVSGTSVSSPRATTRPATLRRPSRTCSRCTSASRARSWISRPRTPPKWRRDIPAALGIDCIDCMAAAFSRLSLGRQSQASGCALRTPAYHDFMNRSSNDVRCLSRPVSIKLSNCTTIQLSSWAAAGSAAPRPTGPAGNARAAAFGRAAPGRPVRCLDTHSCSTATANKMFSFVRFLGR